MILIVLSQFLNVVHGVYHVFARDHFGIETKQIDHRYLSYMGIPSRQI